MIAKQITDEQSEFNKILIKTDEYRILFLQGKITLEEAQPIQND